MTHRDERLRKVATVFFTENKDFIQSIDLNYSGIHSRFRNGYTRQICFADNILANSNLR